SLNHIVEKQKRTKERYIPSFFAFYSEDDAKFIAPIEKQRKEWMYKYIKKKLHLEIQVFYSEKKLRLTKKNSNQKYSMIIFQIYHSIHHLSNMVKKRNNTKRNTNM